MARFLLQRLVEMLVAVWGVVTIVFLVTRVLGDPVSLLLPVGTAPEHLARLRSDLGLDQPLYVQYADFLWNAFHGDFGMSYQHHRPAMEVVLERMPATISLAFWSLVFGIILGAVAGLVAALKRGTFAELAVLTFALVGQATPAFWFGIMLILFFSVQLGWLPTGGTGDWQHFVLPTFALAIFIGANTARLFRSSLLDVFSEDYVRTARAKGLLPRTILAWHVVRNALIPVTTMVGLLAGELLGGSVVTETIFSWPGVGRLIIQAVENRDFPVIQAGVAVVSTLFLLVNLLVDVLYGVLDPRIRFARQG